MEPTATLSPATASNQSTPPPSGHQERLDARRAALREEFARLLPAGAQIVWEIGCGHGHFLTAYAAAHPAECCVGVDQDSFRIRRAGKKQARAQLPNLHFIRAEARLFLDVLPPEMRLAGIHVLFPDPWPKRRHHKHRLLQAEFFHALAARAEPATPFYFRTDHAPYFQEVEALLAAHPDWRIAADGEWPFEEPTVFEQKAAKHYSLVARRR